MSPEPIAPAMTGIDLGFEHHFVSRQGADETLLLLHGTGGHEDDLLPLGAELAPHANLLSPRGKVLEHGMPRFFRRFSAGNLDIEDLKFRARELADFVAAAAKTHGFDPAKVTALGYSNGANVAIGLLFERPGALRRAVLLRAMNVYEPAADVDLAGVDVLVLAGARDPYSRTSDALARTLHARGARVERHEADAGHELVPKDLARVRAWLAGGA